MPARTVTGLLAAVLWIVVLGVAPARAEVESSDSIENVGVSPGPMSKSEAARFQGTRLIGRGQAGAHVAVLQRGLARAGHDPGPIDGKFGPRTEAAVRSLQAAGGAKVDGIVGRQTLAVGCTPAVDAEDWQYSNRC
jgi:hypothetical protein